MREKPAPRMSRAMMISAAGAVFRSSLDRNVARTALSVLAIALGVALGYAVQLINQTAINELELGVQALSGDADLEVRGPRGGFDEAIYPQLARLQEVAVASPVVEVDAKLPEREDSLHVVGLDLFRAALLQPGLIPITTDRFALLRPDTLFLSPAAADWLHVRPEDTLRFQVGLAEVPLSVGGLLPGGAQRRYAVMDIAGAQEKFDRLGRVTRVDLRLVPGADVSAFRDLVRQRLPPGVEIDRPEATIKATARASPRSYRVNLDVLALVALFTGGLLVFSTQALSVVRRRAQFALLRVLGLTRRRLVMLIVAESALQGSVGSVLGLGAGFALAQLAVRWVGGDMGSGYFRGIVPTLVHRAAIHRSLFRARGGGCYPGHAHSCARGCARCTCPGAQGRRRAATRSISLRPVGPGLAATQTWVRSPPLCRRRPACPCSATSPSRCFSPAR